MPNLDIAKIALLVVLVAAVVAVSAWFVAEVVPDVVETGQNATSALTLYSAPAWAAVVSLFGPAWPKAWTIALGFVVLLGSLFFMFRLIRWVQG